MIHIVCGFMRSGTSAMMAALIAGGMDAAYSEKRNALANQHADELYHPNKSGLYEVPLNEYDTPGFPLQYDSKLIKVMSWGVKNLAVHDYRVVVEVGTDRGEYAEQIAARFPGVLYCVDPYTPTVDDIADPHTNRDREADLAAAVARLDKLAVSFIREKSLEAVKGFSAGSLDFVYIDPNHYEIAADLAAWWPKVKPGGIMAGHDLTGEWEPWVRPAVEEFAFWEKLTPMTTRDAPASWFFVKP